MQPLSGTGYVILGMLALGARTGYDIKATVDRSTRFFWAASYGQIYPELRRLEEDGLVEGKSSPTGRRKRTEYSLTDAGQAELVRWLEAPAQTPELRDENLLKLFFADALPAEQALDQLRQRRLGHSRSWSSCGSSMRSLARTRPSSTSSSGTASRTPSSTSPGARSRRRGFARRRRPPRERRPGNRAGVRGARSPGTELPLDPPRRGAPLRAGGVRPRGRVLRGLEAREPRRRDRAWRAPSGSPSTCTSAGVVGPAPSRSSRSPSCSCRP